MVRLALRRLALTVLIATFLTGELAFAADGDAAPAKPAPKPAAKAAPAKSPAAKTTPAPAKAPPAKAAVPPVVPDSPSSSDSSGLSSSSEKEEYSSDDSEYFDYQYSGSSDYAAFEDENYFDWFAEDESEWTSSSVPREDYSYDIWEDDRCDGEKFGDNATAPCDIKVEGGAEATKLKTPLAGVYKSKGCRNGRPLYQRVKKDKNEEDRFIIFSGYWGDWDFASKDQLTDDVTLGYGGEGDGERRPELVKSDDWYIRSTLVDKANSTTDFMESATLTAHCVDMCNDGIQNNNETGIDCGGPCPLCQDLHLDELAERNADLAKDLAALRMKIAAEQKAKEERDQENKVAKVAISFMIVLGAAIVLGGPIIYSLKRGRASGGVGPIYKQVAPGNRNSV